MAGTVEPKSSLPTDSLVVLSAGMAVLAVAAVGFAVVLDGVTSRNRIAASDPRHLHWFVRYRTGILADVAHLVSRLGGAGVLVGLGVLAAVVLWYRGERVRVAVAPLAAVFVAGVATQVIKEVVDRPSPAIGKWAYSTMGSFPSGHAADSSALFVALALVLAIVEFQQPLRRTAAVAAGFGIPALIGVSQLVLAVHWPSDVVAGWGLGSGIGILAVLATVGPRLRIKPADASVPTGVPAADGHST